MLIATATARLTGVTRVNLDHFNTACLSFVLNEGVQLSEAPTMQASFVLTVLVVFASSHLGCFPDIGQVLKHDGRAWGSVLNKAFGEDMVMVTASPKLFTRELTQVAFCTLCAFGLQLSFQTEGAPFLFFPSPLTQELTLGGDSRAVETQINPAHLVRWCDRSLLIASLPENASQRTRRVGNADNDMQGKASLAGAEISTTDASFGEGAIFVSDVLHQVFRNAQGQFNPSVYSSKTTGEGIPLHPVRTLVIADTGYLTVRTLDGLEDRNGLALLQRLLTFLRIALLVLLLPRQRAFDGFGGFHTSGTHQLSRKVRIVGTQWIVRPFVQFNPIATLRRKARMGYSIEARRVLFKRVAEALRLLWSRIELYLYRSIHTKNISIQLYIVNRQEDTQPLAPKRNASFLPAMNGRGFQRRRFYELSLQRVIVTKKDCGSGVASNILQEGT